MLVDKKFESVSSFFSYCSSIYEVSKASPLHAFVVFPQKDITPSDVSEIAESRGLIFKAEKTGKDIYRVEVSVQTRRIVFHLISGDDWWLFLTDAKGSIAKDILLGSFIGKHLPWVLEGAYVNTSQLSVMLDGVRRAFHSVRIRGCKFYQPGITTLKFMKPGGIIQYEEETLRKLEDREKGTISAVKIEFYNPGVITKKTTKARIMTDSQLTFYGGHFSNFYQVLILPYAKAGMATRNRFADRARILEPDQVIITPVQIEFGESYSDVEIGELKNVLVSSYATSVVHHNPVLLVHSADRQDGSCFDIYVEGSLLEVVPLSHATSSAFTRLLSLIMKHSPQVVSIKDNRIELPV